MINIYYVKENFINFLKSFDGNVRSNYNERRPYVGIIFTIDNYDYYIPLSSPKNKHLNMKNNIDFHKIDGGNKGVINFNNMLPVLNSEAILVNINSLDDEYKNLLNEQLIFIKKHQNLLRKKAKKLYYLMQEDDENLSNHQRQVKQRCINFKKLEMIISAYDVNKVY